jgi:hypothetical protein
MVAISKTASFAIPVWSSERKNLRRQSMCAGFAIWMRLREHNRTYFCPEKNLQKFIGQRVMFGHHESIRRIDLSFCG